jgi:hypothetical protein
MSGATVGAVGAVATARVFGKEWNLANWPRWWSCCCPALGRTSLREALVLERARGFATRSHGVLQDPRPTAEA